MNKLTVTDGLVVYIQYTLTLNDGQKIDTTDENEPMPYLHGADEILPNLEAALQGMHIGQTKTIHLTADQAYGQIDKEQYITIPLNGFPNDLNLEIGLELEITNPEEDEIILGTVAQINQENNELLLDLNHPLAGQDLHFQVKITHIRPATAAEKLHGHAHEDQN